MEPIQTCKSFATIIIRHKKYYIDLHEVRKDPGAHNYS